MGVFNLTITEVSINYKYSKIIVVSGIKFENCISAVNVEQEFNISIKRFNFSQTVKINFNDTSSVLVNQSVANISKIYSKPGNYSIILQNDTTVFDTCYVKVVETRQLYIMVDLLSKDIDMNDCLTNCSNNGICESISAKSYRCKCNESYAGKMCELSKNPCSLNQCLNNGICIENNTTELGYECNCTENFNGKKCENLKKNVCPCERANRCFLFMADKGPSCKCINNYSGENCEIESDNLKITIKVKNYTSIIAIVLIILFYLIFIIIDLMNLCTKKEKTAKKQSSQKKLFKHVYIN
jgi:hypothetical protein